MTNNLSIAGLAAAAMSIALAVAVATPANRETNQFRLRKRTGRPDLSGLRNQTSRPGAAASTAITGSKPISWTTGLLSIAAGSASPTTEVRAGNAQDYTLRVFGILFHARSAITLVDAESQTMHFGSSLLFIFSVVCVYFAAKTSLRSVAYSQHIHITTRIISGIQARKHF